MLDFIRFNDSLSNIHKPDFINAQTKIKTPILIHIECCKIFVIYLLTYSLFNVLHWIKHKKLLN
jgi:hypothetical protein